MHSNYYSIYWFSISALIDGFRERIALEAAPDRVNKDYSSLFVVKKCDSIIGIHWIVEKPAVIQLNQKRQFTRPLAGRHFFYSYNRLKKETLWNKVYKILKKKRIGEEQLNTYTALHHSGTLWFSRSSNESSHRHLLVTPLKEKVYSFFRLSHKSTNRLRNVSLRDETTKISQRKDFIFVQKEGSKKFKLKYS